MESGAQADPIPVVEQLSHIYDDYGSHIKSLHQPRYSNIRDRFMALYSRPPQFFARAPGRVNIIGEHIDYCDYAVLPAALEQDFVIAYAIDETSEEIVLSNIDKDQFPQERLKTDPFQKLKEEPHWSNYFLCGYKAVLALDETLAVAHPKGLLILADSLVPPAAGLSSSSALTVCAAVVAAHANHVKVDRGRLADLTVQAERMAGTACGGMDQTISLMAEKGKAKLIEFKPTMVATDVQLPGEFCLVVANSLTPSPKLLTVGTRYNKRVVECRFGVTLLALKLHIISPSEILSSRFRTFRELQVSLNATFEEMVAHCKSHLKSGGYNKQLLQKELGLSDLSELLQDIPHSHTVLEDNYQFMVQERALHVFQEAKRVIDFKQLCDQGGEDLGQKLGKLMDESHFSCKVLYECSSTELDELTGLARKAGALGSRVTGAGWGGCCVSLVKREDVETFVEKVQKEFYLKERPMGEQLWITEDLNKYVFATQPGRGACVLDPQYCIWM